MEKTKKGQRESRIISTKPVFYREFSSGGVVYRKSKIKNSNFKTTWLVTKSSPSKLYPRSVWRIPKGWIDDEEDGLSPGPIASGLKRASEDQLKEAALREVKEEAGVEAKIVKKIGTERYFLISKYKKVLKFVTFYLMEWLKDSPGGYGFETADIAWLPYKDARKKLTYPSEKKILDKARELLDAGTQQTLI